MDKTLKIKEDFSERLVTATGCESDVSSYDYSDQAADAVLDILPDDFRYLLNHNLKEHYDYITLEDPFTDTEYDVSSADVFESLEDIKDMRSSFTNGDSVIYIDSNGVVQTITGDLDEIEELNDIWDRDCNNGMIACGRGVPYKIFDKNTKEGLIYLGYSDNFIYFFNYYSDNYTIVVYGDSDDFYEFDSSVSQFLYDIYTDKINLFKD